MTNYSGFSGGEGGGRGRSKRPGAAGPPAKTRAAFAGRSQIGAGNDRPMSREQVDFAVDDSRVNMLAEEVTKLRAQGATWAQIEAETAMPAAQCAMMASNYLRAQYTGTSVEEARQLQIMRLEMLMQMLYSQVEDGDLFSQGRQTANLINTINSVTELLDLRKDKLRDEQMRLTQEQGGMLIAVLQAVENAVVSKVLDLLTERSDYSVELGQRYIPDLTAVRAQLERDWAGWFAEAADNALELMSADSNDATAEKPVAAGHAARVLHGKAD